MVRSVIIMHDRQWYHISHTYHECKHCCILHIRDCSSITSACCQYFGSPQGLVMTLRPIWFDDSTNQFLSNFRLFFKKKETFFLLKNRQSFKGYLLNVPMEIPQIHVINFWKVLSVTLMILSIKFNHFWVIVLIWLIYACYKPNLWDNISDYPEFCFVFVN